MTNRIVKMIHIIKTLPLTLIFIISASYVQAANIEAGKTIVENNCLGCHGPGVLNAPKLGDSADWKKRLDQGMDVLLSHAVNGFGNMPAKGGNTALAESDIQNAISYFLSKADLAIDSPDSAPKQNKSPVADVKKAAAPVTKSTSDEKAVNSAKSSASANKFNRLMKSKAEWNPPQSEDGIHDPDNEGTYALQPPKEAFEGMPSNAFGNHIDWVKSLEENAINPRFDRNDPTKKPFVMDLNIVRQVKGSMPDVVYPHKQHTEWLDCSNCHPAIFIPKKGANQISMAGILMGQKCGVCHGKVAFPVSECRRCHSKKKVANKN